ncbi:MAG: CHAT domain-containing protein [Acidobacteria bacterium]|nr:CHAT domain-containing protein [Acidobacteriota bacterium]
MQDPASNEPMDFNLGSLVLSLESNKQDIRELKPGAPIEREMEGGQSHAYQIALAAGQYMHVVVDQRGIDVVVIVFGPDGQQLIEMDSPNGTQGPEEVSVIAEISGYYLLEVRALDQEAVARHYEVRIEELREPVPQDKIRITAEKAFAEGQRLRIQGTAESLRRTIEKYEEAVPLWRAVGDQRGEAHTLSNIGLVYNWLGEPQTALDYLSQALQLRRTMKDHHGEAATLNNIGMAYWLMGELQKALDYYSQALPLGRVAGNRFGEATTLYNIGSSYASLGECHKALDFFDQALRVSQVVKGRIEEACALTGIGRVYDAVGEPQRALDCYNQALPLRRAVGDHYGEAKILHYIGVIYDDLGEKQKALNYLGQALRLRRIVGDRWGEAQTLHSIGRLYASLNKEQKALEYYEQALSLWQAVGNRIGEAETLHGIARVERSLGKLTEARAQVETALDLIESVRTKIISQDLRASFFATNRTHYEFYIDLLMQLHQRHPWDGFDAAALQASERARARSLLETLTEAHADIRQGVDSVLLERERTLQQQLNARAQRHKYLAADEPTIESAAKDELEVLLTEYQEVQAQIRAGSPRYAALTQPQPLIVTEIQQQVLDENTLLLEYALGEERSYLWAVTPTSIASFELPKRAEIDAAARRVYDLLAARNKRVKFETLEEKQARVARADAEYPEAAAALSQMVLGPVAWQLGKKRLLIVSEGALQYVPFGALPVPNGDAAKGRHGDAATERRGDTVTQGRRQQERLATLPFHHVAASSNPYVATSPCPRVDFVPLVAKHEIMSLPSASVLAVLRQELAERPPATEAVAVLADPVFDSEDPRVTVTSLMGKDPIGRSSASGSKRTPMTRTVDSSRISDFQTSSPVGWHGQPNLSTAQEWAEYMPLSGMSRDYFAEQLRTLSPLHPLTPDLERSVRESGLADDKPSIPRLPFTREEAEGIMAHLSQGRGLKALDFSANRAMVTDAKLNQYRIVHFATHGLLNSQHPELSGIVLSLVDEQGQPQDGFLRAHEIYNLNLSADLVVLSGCRTGLGKEVKGEGLVGLTRGFMYAGAARVVVSLWDVHDAATAKLMKRFYQGMLADGLRPAAALRAAQVAMWRERRWEAPYYWAGFQLQGEWR